MAMDDSKALALYEKYYFHELESLEKLTPRLQLSLTMLSALIGVVIYIVARINFSAEPSVFVRVVFTVTFVLGCVLLVVAAISFLMALWGHTYECLPTAIDVEKYRAELIDTYKAFSDGAETAADYFQKFLLRYYAECAAHNADLNAKRYDALYECLSYMILSLPCIFTSALVFTLGGMAKNAAG
jgi:hypothetical protein